MIRRSRIRPPTWSSIVAVDRPLFGLAIIPHPYPLARNEKRASCGLHLDQRDRNRFIPAISPQQPATIAEPARPPVCPGATHMRMPYRSLDHGELVPRKADRRTAD